MYKCKDCKHCRECEKDKRLPLFDRKQFAACDGFQLRLSRRINWSFIIVYGSSAVISISLLVWLIRLIATIF